MTARIAVVSSLHPVPPDTGSRLRVYHLTRALAEEGFSVRLLVGDSERDDAIEGPLRDCCKEIHVLARSRCGPSGSFSRMLQRVVVGPIPVRPELRRELSRVLFDWQPDFVQAEKTFLGAQLDLRALGDRGIRIVLDEAGVHHVAFEREVALATNLFARARARRRARRLAHFEADLIGRVDAVTAVSQTESTILRRLTPQANVLLVPNGVDPALLEGESAAAKGEVGLVFVGKLSYLPNADAARLLLREVRPHLRERGIDCPVILIGGDEPDDIRALAARDASVRLVGYVAEIAPWLRRFAIMVNPMRLGGGTRLKLLEALGAGMACVSTSIGAEGVEARDGDHVLLADDAATFAAAVERIVKDSELRRSLGQRGRELIRAQYTWRAVTRELVAFYHEPLADGARRKRSKMSKK